ncbi:MAG: glycosyltransferase family 1 protein, partial [Candidatus Nitrosotenuis sp.]
MRIIIAGAISKFFHLKEFSNALQKNNITCKLIHDASIVDGFPSRNIKKWISSDSKFDELVREFRPDLVVIDRQRHFGLSVVKKKLPLLVMLRGDFWSE